MIIMYEDSLDGVAAAAVVYRYHGYEQQRPCFLPIIRGQDARESMSVIEEGEETWVLNVLMGAAEWIALSRKTNEIAWVARQGEISAHHEMIRLHDGRRLFELPGAWELSKSSSLLTWERCYLNARVPWIIRAIQETLYCSGNEDDAMPVEESMGPAFTEPWSLWWGVVLNMCGDDDLTKRITSLAIRNFRKTRKDLPPIKTTAPEPLTICVHCQNMKRISYQPGTYFCTANLDLVIGEPLECRTINDGHCPKYKEKA